jgi:hypothetical protein
MTIDVGPEVAVSPPLPIEGIPEFDKPNAKF